MKIKKLTTDVLIGSQISRPSQIEIEHYRDSIPQARLFFSGANKTELKRGDSVQISLNNEVVFSAPIESVGASYGLQKVICKYAPTPSSLNFKGESIRNIYKELCEQSELPYNSSELPDIEYEHYHAQGDSWRNLLALKESLSQRSEQEYDLYLNAEGKVDVIEKNSPVKDSKITFKRSVNTILMDDKYLKSWPLALNYGDKIIVENKPSKVTGLNYRIAPRNSIMEVYYESLD